MAERASHITRTDDFGRELVKTGGGWVSSEMVRDVQTLSLRTGLDTVYILSPAWLFAQDAECGLADDFMR